MRYCYSNIMKRFVTSSVNSDKKICPLSSSVTVVPNNDTIDYPTYRFFHSFTISFTDGNIDQTIKYMTGVFFQNIIYLNLMDSFTKFYELMVITNKLTAQYQTCSKTIQGQIN